MDSRFGPDRRATLTAGLALDSGAMLPAIDIAYARVDARVQM